MDALRENDPQPFNGSTTAGSIFKIIRDYGPLYGTEIVRRTGLAKSTVSANLDRLVSVGLVREEIPDIGKRRKLKVAESAGYVVGVALGQTHLNVALCDLEAEIIGTVGGDVDLVRESPETILSRVVEYARELEARAGLGPSALFGLGLGLPSPVEHGVEFRFRHQAVVLPAHELVVARDAVRFQGLAVHAYARA